MKKTLAMATVLSLAGCEYNVREEPAPRPYEPPTYEPSPTPMPSSSSSSSSSSDASSQPKLPSPSPGGDEDASAAPAYTCEGTAMDCEAFDSLTCNQSGCTALSDGRCIGSPTPCRWLVSETACGEQIGCTWTAPPPR